MITKKGLEKDFQKHNEISNSIKRYHILKPKPESEWGDGRKRGSIINEDEEQKDPYYGLSKEEYEELYRQQIYLNLELKKLFFAQKRHEPDPKYPNEKYFLEIKACYKGMRRTLPEDYKDFSKSILNEYFNMAELVSFKFCLRNDNFLEKKQNVIYCIIQI